MWYYLINKNNSFPYSSIITFTAQRIVLWLCLQASPHAHQTSTYSTNTNDCEPPRAWRSGGPWQRAPEGDNFFGLVVDFLSVHHCLYWHVGDMLVDRVLKGDGVRWIRRAEDFAHFQWLIRFDVQSREEWIWAHCLGINFLQAVRAQPIVRDIFITLWFGTSDPAKSHLSLFALHNFVLHQPMVTRFIFIPWHFLTAVVHSNCQEGTSTWTVNVGIKRSYFIGPDKKLKLGFILEWDGWLELRFLKGIIVKCVP